MVPLDAERLKGPHIFRERSCATEPGVELLMAAPHDSGPMWVARSHSYDSSIHYTSPV